MSPTLTVAGTAPVCGGIDSERHPLTDVAVEVRIANHKDVRAAKGNQNTGVEAECRATVIGDVNVHIVEVLAGERPCGAVRSV